MKKCKKCEQEKDSSSFPKDLKMKDGLNSWCKCCRKEYKKQPNQKMLARAAKRKHRNENYEHYRKIERIREYKNKYGITLEIYDEMRELQNYCCAICGNHEDSGKFGKLFVDHDHKTGKIRQLLCDKCNVGLGSFKDSPDFLKNAIEYLIRHRS
jgi:Recombination endonuclease VII